MISTEHLDASAKSAVLLEALPYVQQFRDAIFVVKYGGAFMDDAHPETRNRVALDIAFLSAVGIKVVVVHGGGKAITRALAESKLATRFEHGLRVTDAEAIKVVEHTLNKVVNSDICEILRARNARPLGIHGNSILVCEKKQIVVDGEPLDTGFVGETHTVKTGMIEEALDKGRVPVISPIAVDEGGQVYNTNADAAAARIAAALKARRLVYLCDVPGLMRDVSDPASLISSLSVEEVAPLVAAGAISKGMIPKTNSAVDALRDGVHRVHFIHGEQPHSLLLEIFTHRGIGTEIVHA